MKVYKIALNAGAMSKKQGIEKAPEKIAGFLKDYYLTEKGVLPLFDLKEIAVDNNNLSQSHTAIQEEIEKSDSYSIIIGGDHSLSYPAFKAFAKKHPGAGLIVFDAHPDLQENHAPPTHEDYLRVLIEEGVVDKNNVILIGTRNMSKEEKKFLQDNKIKNFSMNRISFDSLREITDTVMSLAREWSRAYISIDIDVLDPAFAPGTGYCEPGGLTTRQLLYIIHRLKMLRNIGMCDIVEVNPDKDVHDLTSRTAAKLVVELS